MPNLAQRPWSEEVIATPGNEQAGALDGALADLLDLSLLAKQAHWNVVGPRFSALHALFDDLDSRFNRCPCSGTN